MRLLILDTINFMRALLGIWWLMYAGCLFKEDLRVLLLSQQKLN